MGTQNINASGSVQDQLNRCMPAAADGKLGNVLAELIAKVNAQDAQIAALTTAHNAAMAKLDADSAVTDDDYASENGASAYTADSLKDLESR